MRLDITCILLVAQLTGAFPVAGLVFFEFLAIKYRFKVLEGCSRLGSGALQSRFLVVRDLARAEEVLVIGFFLEHEYWIFKVSYVVDCIRVAGLAGAGHFDDLSLGRYFGGRKALHLEHVGDALVNGSESAGVFFAVHLSPKLSLTVVHF